MLTPKQILAQATAQANAALIPSRQKIQAAIMAAEQQRLNQQHAAQGIIGAVSGMSAGLSAQAQAAYGNAADRVAAYGQGFTGELRDIQTETAAAAQNLIGRFGAPGQVTPRGTPAQNANVSYLLGGQIPAEGLAAEAARALTNVGERRYAAGLGLADKASLASFQAQQGIGKVRQQLAELEATRPGLIQKAVDAIRAGEADRAEAMLAQANKDREYALDVRQQQQDEYEDARDAALDRAGDLTTQTGWVYTVDGKGNVVRTGERTASWTQAQKAEAGRQIRAGINPRTGKPIPGGAKTPKPPTPVQKATRIAAAQQKGSSILKTFVDHLAKDQADRDDDGNIIPEDFRHLLDQNYGKAMYLTIAAIGSSLHEIGYTPAKVKALARAMVESAFAARAGG